MLFNSFVYAIFLPIVFVLYWMIPHTWRWMLLLVSSYYFYMSWSTKYVLLIIFMTMVSYVAGRMLENASVKHRKWIVVTIVLTTLGVLFFFKYFDFFSKSVAEILGIFSVPFDSVVLNYVLPVGISFYTFQTIGYVIDVYKGEVAAEHHLGKYAAFVAFFPQLVAGPIERTKNLLPQIKAKHSFNYSMATYGLKLMTWGYFKKLVIADALSQYASKVWASPRDYQGFALLLAAVFFTFQIYCDFSGYSDIAVGTAKLFGIDLMANFKSPYLSQGLKEFWKRWHISLSSWFKDYVYIPLGGNRVGNYRHYINLMITFLLSGLWHGANWKFVLWGGIHGIGLVLTEKLSIRAESKGAWKYVRIVAVFTFCAFAWIFFVSNSYTDGIYVITNALTGIGSTAEYLSRGLRDIGMGKGQCATMCVFVLLLCYFDWLSLRMDVIDELGKKREPIRWCIYLCMVFIIIFFSQKGEATEFVYFQF